MLEPTTVEVLRQYGLAERLEREGHLHDGMKIAWAGRESFLIDIQRHLGKRFVAYRKPTCRRTCSPLRTSGSRLVTEAQDVNFHDITSDRPAMTSDPKARSVRVECDFVAGCDGFHGVSRPEHSRRGTPRLREDLSFRLAGHSFRKHRPFLTLPTAIIRVASRWPRCAIRNSSRYYLQVPLDTRIEDWPDARFWEELARRFPSELAASIVTGPSIEKSMRRCGVLLLSRCSTGVLFLAGDAAHIVPPTGAKGLNLAVSDVFYLGRALASYYVNTAICCSWMRQPYRPEASLERGARLLVSDDTAASFPRCQRLRPACAGVRAGQLTFLPARAGCARRAVRRSPSLD